jgi:hypothetical protein
LSHFCCFCSLSFHSYLFLSIHLCSTFSLWM